WMRGASLTTIFAALLNPGGWLAAAGIVASMAGLPLLRLRWLGLAAPPLIADLLSAHHPQPELLFQYGLPLVLPVRIAGGLDARRLLEWRLLARTGPALALRPLAVPAL